MFVTALLLGLVGVFCILDSRILGRMNFERPLITCTIVGALLGDLQTGLTLGASIELMSLGIVNIGAAAPPDMNMAAIICAAFAILTDASAAGGDSTDRGRGVIPALFAICTKSGAVEL